MQSWMAVRCWPLAAIKRRGAVPVTVVLVVILIFFISSHLQFLLWSAGQPHCKFAEQLTVYVTSGLHRNGPRTVITPSPQPSDAAVVGHATVFYVWCGRRPFEFRNYLSVRSVMRTLRPDTVWFYYESEPVVDGKLYNTWWHELIDDVPFFHRRSLLGVVGGRDACDGPGRPSVDFVHALVTSRGGTFVDESTLVVARLPDDGVTVAIEIGEESNVRLQLLKADRGISCSAVSLNSSLRWSPPTVWVLECPSDSKLADANSTFCIRVARSLYPKDIWTLDGDLGRIVRREFYGLPDVVTPAPSFDRLAPNIGHVIWVGGGKMNFLFFLCVLSLLHVAKVDVVYVHGDQPPTGIYWDMLVNSRQKVQLVLRENAGQVCLSRILILCFAHIG